MAKNRLRPSRPPRRRSQTGFLQSKRWSVIIALTTAACCLWLLVARYPFINAASLALAFGSVFFAGLLALLLLRAVVMENQRRFRDPHQALSAASDKHLATLARAAAKSTGDMRFELEALLAHGEAISGFGDADPVSNPLLTPFFTNVLPQAAELVRNRRNYARNADHARVKEADAALKALVPQFAAFEDALIAPEMTSVDLDVKLLQKALNDEKPDHALTPN